MPILQAGWRLVQNTSREKARPLWGLRRFIRFWRRVPCVTLYKLRKNHFCSKTEDMSRSQQINAPR